MINALCIHGIGYRTPAAFADKAMARLGAVKPVTVRSLHWGPLVDSGQDAMLERAKAHGSSARPINRISAETLGDALAYQNYMEQIAWVADYEVSQLKGPVTIFAHSLGCLIALDYMRMRPGLKVAQFFTLGCNAEAFNVGAVFVPPVQVAGKGVWENLIDEDDAIGWPTNGWQPQSRDHLVSVGSWFTGWSGLSHAAYWNDRKLWSKVIPNLIR
jgi:pimeloyl-ACP methyl ester carboxylesterase